MCEMLSLVGAQRRSNPLHEFELIEQPGSLRGAQRRSNPLRIITNFVPRHNAPCYETPPP